MTDRAEKTVRSVELELSREKLEMLTEMAKKSNMPGVTVTVQVKGRRGNSEVPVMVKIPPVPEI